MATTHLTDIEAQALGVSDLLCRAQSGEEFHIETDSEIMTLGNLPTPDMDDSAEATLARCLEIERITGEPFCMDDDFAADMREILAMRRPSRGDPWES